MSCLLDLLGKVHPGGEFKEFPFQFFCEKQDAEELNLADDFLGKLPTIDMIKAYEAQVIWLPKLYRHHLERGGKPPDYGPIRYDLPRSYLKVGMWWEADQAVTFFSKYKPNGFDYQSYVRKYACTAERILEVIREQPGIPQRDFYKIFPDVDRYMLATFFRETEMLIKSPYKKTYRLYLREEFE